MITSVWLDLIHPSSYQACNLEQVSCMFTQALSCFDPCHVPQGAPWEASHSWANTGGDGGRVAPPQSGRGGQPQGPVTGAAHHRTAARGRSTQATTAGP